MHAPDARSPSVLRLAAPLVVSFWMRAAFTLVDTAYAATIGDAAVAAIGLTVPFEFLMIAVWVGLSTGLTSALSRGIGAREGAKIDQYKAACWRLVLIVSPVFVAIGAGIFLLAPRLALAPDVRQAFGTYGSVLVGGSALTAFWSVIPDSVVKAHHDTRSTMWAGITSNLINVALNTLFTFGFRWGVFGIAFATVLGKIGGLAYALGRARRHEEARRAAGRDVVPGLDAAPYRAILALAVPVALTFTLMAAESAILNFVFARLEDAKEAIAAYSIYHRAALFAYQPMIAGAVALLPFVARRIGEGDAAGARRGLREAMVAAAVYATLVLGPIALLLAEPVAARLAESERTRAYATTALRLVPLACLAGAPFTLCRPVFEGLGRGGPGLVMALLRYGILTAPAAWAGLAASRALARPPILGPIVALCAAAAVCSAIYLAWVRLALREQAGRRAAAEGG